VTRSQSRRARPRSTRRAGGGRRRHAGGAPGRSPSRRQGDSRNGVRRPAGNGPGSSPGRPRRVGPPSRSSSDAWRCRSRRLPGARTGRGCSATSPVNSTTAGSTTATWSPSRWRSTPSTRRSVAESAQAGADSHRRHGPTDRGDIPRQGVTRPDADVTPAEPPSQATGHRPPATDVSQAKTSKLSRRGCHQTAEIGAFSHGRSAPAVGVRMATRSEEKR